MRFIFETVVFPFLPRPTVALATMNAVRKQNAQGKRNHNGRFIRAYRVK